MPDKTIVQKPVTKADFDDAHLYLVGSTPKTGTRCISRRMRPARASGRRAVISGPVTYDPGSGLGWIRWSSRHATQREGT